jgi:hypothetical protein
MISVNVLRVLYFLGRFSERRYFGWLKDLLNLYYKYIEPIEEVSLEEALEEVDKINQVYVSECVCEHLIDGNHTNKCIIFDVGLKDDIKLLESGGFEISKATAKKIIEGFSKLGCKHLHTPFEICNCRNEKCVPRILKESYGINSYKEKKKKLNLIINPD